MREKPYSIKPTDPELGIVDKLDNTASTRAGEPSMAGEIMTPEESRTVSNYFTELGVNWEDLRGKRVLDLGSGLGHFAEAARKMGVEVIAMDKHPGWHDKNWSPKTQSPFLVGDGLKMPFKDKSFDLILSRAAVHSMIEVEDDLDTLIGESLRVLKPGGEFRFGPGSPVPFEYMRKSESSRQEQLNQKEQTEGLTEEERLELQGIVSAYERRKGNMREFHLALNRTEDAEQRGEVIKQNALKTMRSIYQNVEMFDTDNGKGPYVNFSFRLWKPN